MNDLFGIRFVEHWLAVSVRHKVERHPIKKRRRNWRVVRVSEPGAFKVRDPFTGVETMYVHPKIMAELKKHSNTPEGLTP